MSADTDYMISDILLQPTALQGEVLSDPGTTIMIGTTPSQVLSSGDNNTSFDVGIFIPVQVAGQIFNDLNANGILDPDEPLLTGATLNVVQTDSDGNPVPGGTNEWLTSSDGTYSVNLPPGTYMATVLPPTPDYWLSPLSDPQDVGNDFNPLTYTTLPITLTSGQDGTGNFDAGFYEKVTISNQVFNDPNGNGVQDPDEGPYVGELTINLYDPNSVDPDVPVATVTTSDGSFTFPDITPGEYTLEFVPEDETVTFSPQNVGTDDCADSDVDPTTGMVSVTVVSGEDITCVNAGVTQLPSVGPYVVFEDNNGNGLQDRGEVGLPGVSVTLVCEGVVIETVVTGADGVYEFNQVTPASCYISVVNVPDFQFSPVVDGGNSIYPNGTSTLITLNTGDVTTVPTLDVGMYEPVLLGNKVWNDLNGDGVQQTNEPGMVGITATLFDGEGVELNTTTTDADGYVSRELSLLFLCSS